MSGNPCSSSCRRNILRDFLLGTMVGDAIGLPFEGMSRSRVLARLHNRPLGHRLLPRSGMVSDDTEHALLTLAAWRRSGGHPERFHGFLASELRWWFLSLPAGTGLATAKASLRLLARVPPERSGVPSAGNGPLMRAGVLGALCDHEEDLSWAIRAASRITHTDQRAEHAALAIALIAHTMKTVDSCPGTDHRDLCLQAVYNNLPEGPVSDLVRRAEESARRGETTQTFLDSLGCREGVSGFVMHTLPAVIHIWMTSPEDYKDGVTAAVRLGGDTDSTAAIVGGLIAMRSGRAGIPTHWLRGVRDYPNGQRRILRWSDPGTTGMMHPALRWPVQFGRNLIFLLVILLHALGRLLPPYGRARHHDW